MFYLNLTLIFISSYFALAQKKLLWTDHLLGVFINSWAVLIFTGYLLGITNQLGNENVYFALSLLLSFMTWGLFRLKIFREVSTRTWTLKSSTKFERKGVFLLCCLMGIFFSLVLLICFFYLPNNPDTEAYRLPRVYFYRDQGNLLHFTTKDVDVRMLFYPLHGVLAHMIFAVYHLDSRWMHFFTFASWALSGVAVFGLSRRLGASLLGSSLAAAITVTTAEIFNLAAAGNDEILAALPMLCALSFGVAWVQTKRKIFSALALLSAVISVGVKEHYVFYILFFVYLGFYLIVSSKWKKSWSFVKEHRVFLGLSVLSAALFSLSHHFLNLKSAGIASTQLGKYILNYSLSIYTGIQNLILYALQFLLTPIPDLWTRKSLEYRNQLYSEFQEFFDGFLGWVNTSSSHISPHEGFKGLLVIPESAFRTETTTWYGWVPLLLTVALLVLRKVKAWKETIAPWLVISFFLWLVTFAFILKFQYTIQSYFSYPLLIALPALALAWDAAKELSYFLRKLLQVLFIFVLGTNSLFAFNFLRDNTRRNLQALRIHGFVYQNQGHMDARAVDFIKAASRIHLIAAHSEIPFLNFIEKNPRARWSVSRSFPENLEFPSLAAFQAFSEYGHYVLDLPFKNTPGLGYLGNFDSTYGPEYILCRGGDDSRCQGQHIKLSSSITLSSKGVELLFEKPALGETSQDRLLYRFQVLTGSKRVLKSSNWISFFKNEKFAFQSSLDSAQKLLLRIEIKEEASHEAFKSHDFELQKGIAYSVK